jgi:signal transduction histidine kinase
MVRRPLPSLVLGMGLAVVLFGVVSLERVFVRERADALEALAGERAALQGYALVDLEERCQDELAAQLPRPEAALEDPLVDASGLVFVEAGRQRLPRLFAFLDEKHAEARVLYDQLLSGGAPERELDEDDPWLERLRLFASFREAIESGNRRGIERDVRAILTHRTRFAIQSVRDLTAMVALLELLEEQAGADPALMAAVLRDGFTDSRGARTPGLQAQLLGRRDKLSRSDFEFLAARIEELSEGSGVAHGDFHDRVAEPAGAAVELLEVVSSPMLLERGAWYVEPSRANVVGVAVDLQALLARTRSEMLERGLLDGSDDLQMAEPSKAARAFSTIEVAVGGPRWESRRAAAEHRFWLKTGLAVALLALLGGASVLGVAWNRRERQLLALKSDFVATVSHELRTPLASMRLMAETLERRLEGLDSARDYPARLIREIDALSFLVENILSFNRLDKGRWTPRVEDVRLFELLSGFEQELAGATGARVSVRIEGAGDLVVRADPELVRLLFLNLGTNACKYNEGDPVTIRIEALPGQPTIVRLIDNGIGIPVEEREKVFSEFYRADRRGRGFGLGLAICRRIMELHAGHIRVADSSAGGTVFEMSFP